MEREFLINYGYPIHKSVVTKAVDGIEAAKKADAWVQAHGHSLDNVQIMCVGIHESINII